MVLHVSSYISERGWHLRAQRVKGRLRWLNGAVPCVNMTLYIYEKNGGAQERSIHMMKYKCSLGLFRAEEEERQDC